MMKLCIALSAIAALFAAGMGQSTAAERLSGEKLKAEYSGVRLYANTPSGRVVLHDYNKDGTITGAVGGKSRAKDLDKGKWWVKGDTLCRTWVKWRKKKPDACFRVENEGGNATWYRSDGSVYRVWRVSRSEPGTQVDYKDMPRCADVGGYAAYMEKTGKTCKLN